VPVNDKIVARARELFKEPGVRDYGKLRRIISGKAKSVDVNWWRKENGLAPHQVAAKAEKDFKAKLDKIRAMTDPAQNPNQHQRKVAEVAFAKLEAAGPAKAPHTRSAPGLGEYDREEAQFRERLERVNAEAFARFEAELARRKAAKAAATTQSPLNTTTRASAAKLLNTTTAKPRPEPPLNTTTSKKPRSADRHREPNRDRHRPGYMREYMADYMRRRRAAEKKNR
jgi:hypothetical protein